MGFEPFNSARFGSGPFQEKTLFLSYNMWKNLASDCKVAWMRGLLQEMSMETSSRAALLRTGKSTGSPVPKPTAGNPS